MPCGGVAQRAEDARVSASALGAALVSRFTVRSPGGPRQSSWDGFELTDEGRRMLRELEAEGEAAELWLKVRRRAVGT